MCVPPSDVIAGERRASKIENTLLGAGLAVWDGCDEEVRRTETAQPEQIRIVHYASMRGLEGWTTLLIGLDEFYANKVKHPGIRPGDASLPEDVAKRWLLMALTRAAQTLAVIVSDPGSPVASWLREAAAKMPDGVVEWHST